MPDENDQFTLEEIRAELERRQNGGELEDIHAEIQRRLLSGLLSGSEKKWAAEVLAQRRPPVKSAVEWQELQDIAADLGRRFKQSLDDLDETKAAAAQVEVQVQELKAAAAAQDPLLMMAKAVDAVAMAVVALTRSMSQRDARPTTKIIERNAEGDIVAIIEEPLADPPR